MSILANKIRELSLQVLQNSIPTDYIFGSVKSINPLEIQLLGLNKETLTAPFLDIGRNLKKQVYKISLRHEHKTLEKEKVEALVGETVDPSAMESWKVVGKTTEELMDVEIIINKGLEEGDTVILLKKQGGQKFLIWDVLTDIHNIHEEEVYENDTGV